VRTLILLWHGLVWTAVLSATGALGLFGFSRIKARSIAAAHPPAGACVTIDGAQFHYTERLPSGAPRAAIVLLHGASGNQADLMLPLGDRLKALGFRVVAPDRPGHGWSGRTGGQAAASPARQAAWLRLGLEAIGIDHAIVLGHSWSGALAVNFALDHADFTDGIVLLAPATHPWPGGLAWYYGPAASPRIGPLFNRIVTMPVGLLLLDAGIRAVFAPQAPPQDFACRSGLPLVLRPHTFMANAQDVFHLNLFVEQQAPRMGSITAPVAIVTGDSDGVVLTHLHSDGSHRDIPGATLTVLAGIGHSPHWSDPARVVDAVVEVASRVEQQQAVVCKRHRPGCFG
jgi:pimeloyl-ACP methyl ester carboxylesterase